MCEEWMKETYIRNSICILNHSVELNYYNKTSQDIARQTMTARIGALVQVAFIKMYYEVV